jgi:hypothetical protein
VLTYLGRVTYLRLEVMWADTKAHPHGLNAWIVTESPGHWLLEVVRRPEGSKGCVLENSDLNVDERSDYIFVVPANPELRCTLQEKGTGLFAAQPNPFEDEQCGPSGPICWASDHNGTRASLSCQRSAKHNFSLASW